MLKANKNPCSSCPYRKDHPSGVWHAVEYEKLRKYDNQEIHGVFLCHQSHVTTETVCKGWLEVHRDSLSVRLAVLDGKIDPADVDVETSVELFESGNAAADHGLSRLLEPSDDASRMVRKLLGRRIGRV